MLTSRLCIIFKTILSTKSLDSSSLGFSSSASGGLSSPNISARRSLRCLAAFPDSLVSCSGMSEWRRLRNGPWERLPSTSYLYSQRWLPYLSWSRGYWSASCRDSLAVTTGWPVDLPFLTVTGNSKSSKASDLIERCLNCIWPDPTERLMFSPSNPCRYFARFCRLTIEILGQIALQKGTCYLFEHKVDGV